MALLPGTPSTCVIVRIQQSVVAGHNVPLYVPRTMGMSSKLFAASFAWNVPVRRRFLVASGALWLVSPTTVRRPTTHRGGQAARARNVWRTDSSRVPQWPQGHLPKCVRVSRRTGIPITGIGPAACFLDQLDDLTQGSDPTRAASGVWTMMMLSTPIADNEMIVGGADDRVGRAQCDEVSSATRALPAASVPCNCARARQLPRSSQVNGALTTTTLS